MLSLFLRYIRQYRVMIAVFFAGVFIELLFQYMVALSFKFLLDEAIIPGNMEILLAVLAFLLAFGLMSLTAGYINDLRMARLGTVIAEDLRRSAYRSIHHGGLRFVQRFSTSEINARFQYDIPAIERFLIRLLSAAVPALLSMLIGLTFLLFLQPVLGLVVFAGMLLLFIPGYLFSDEEDDYLNLHVKEDEALGGAVEESVRNVRLIHAHNRLGNVGERFEHLLGELSGTHLRYLKLKAKLTRLPQALFLLFRITVLGAGGWLTFRGVLSPGDFVAFVTIFLLVFQQGIILTSIVTVSSQPAVNWLRYQDLIGNGESGGYPEEDRGAVHFKRSLRFEDVTFTYGDQHAGVRGLSATVQKGTLTMITGPSGSGKSTLLHLLAGFYKPASGELYIDDAPLSALDPHAYRQQMAFVFQEPTFIDGSIRDNLVFLSEVPYTDEELYDGLRKTGMAESVRRMKDGLDTPVESRLGSLSGGEAQRLALARALLTKPDILVLDEVTSALDPRSEAEIRAMIQSLTPALTVIMITHRLDHGQDADQILVMDQGRLAEQGTYRELTASGGLFSSLLTKQTGFSISSNGQVAEVEGSRLNQIPLFASIGSSPLEELSEAFITEVFEEGETVIYEGDLGDQFYLIARGKVSVRSGGAAPDDEVAVLEDGDYFGELALLHDEPRNATIIAKEKTTCLMLKKDDFHGLLQAHPQVRQAVEHEAARREGQKERSKQETARNCATLEEKPET